MLDIMKSKSKLNVKNVDLHVEHVIVIVLIVIYVNGTENQALNLIVHVQRNNTQMQKEDVNLVIFLVKNV